MTEVQFRITRPGANVLVTMRLYEENDEMVCAIQELGGEMRLPPKAWLRAARAEMACLETIARDAGCQEMRMAGRDWSRVFPDYQPYRPANNENGLRKVLT